MKTSLRQKLLLAVGLSASLLASFNLFAQEATLYPAVNTAYVINSQGDYLRTVNSISDLATKLYDAHQKFPQLMYSHVYGNTGELIGFTVTGVPYATVADQISLDLMQLEVLGNAVYKMDHSFLPESNERLTSRISKKRAIQSMIQVEESEKATHTTSANADDFTASLD